MPRLLPRPRRHKPQSRQATSAALGLRLGALPQPLFPACSSPLNQPQEAEPVSYWRHQALREALMAALITSLLTSAVHAAPQLFTQSPAESLQSLKSLLLPGVIDKSTPSLLDCP